MKKKLMMVAVLLGALSLGACVDDNESQSVTNLRDAKAAQLQALAEQARAEGEAAKITAEAEKAYKDALAAYWNQQAEQNAEQFAAELEALKAEYEERIAEAKKDQAAAEQALLDQADERLKSLYAYYLDQVKELSTLRGNLADYNYDYVRFQANLVKADEWITKQTNIKQASIDDKKQEIEAWKTYGGMDKAELEAQQLELQQAQYAAFKTWQDAEEAAKPLKEAADEVLTAYDVENCEGTSTVAAVAALQKYNDLAYPDGSNCWFKLSETEASDLVSNGYVRKEDLVYNDEDPANKFYEAHGFIQIWDGTNWLYVKPTTVEQVNLSEELQTAYNVPKYALYNELVSTAISQYYANEKSSVESYLGTPAGSNKLATGLYLTKEEKTSQLTDAQAALQKAEEEFAKLEKAYKDAADAATAAKKTAQTNADDAKQATVDAETALKKAQQGTDAAAITAAQNAYDAAVKAESAANTALVNAINAESDANTKETTAQQAYNTSKNTTVPDAKKKVQDLEKELAKVNDDIDTSTKQLENWDEAAAAWSELVAALSSDEYAKAIEGLKSEQNVAAYIAALTEAEKAEDAYDDAETAATTVNNLLYNSNVKDAAEEIRTLENEIAELEAQIAGLKDINVGGLDSAAWYEEQIAGLEVDIQEIEAQIAIQEDIVEMAKARVEEAIAEMTPETEA